MPAESCHVLKVEKLKCVLPSQRPKRNGLAAKEIIKVLFFERS